MEAGDGRRKTEDGIRKTEYGRRRTEYGRRNTEDGRRKTEDGRPKTDGEEGNRQQAVMIRACYSIACDLRSSIIAEA
jgi:hypothetical protein